MVECVLRQTGTEWTAYELADALYREGVIQGDERPAVRQRITHKIN